MKITKRQLSLIINEYYGSGIIKEEKGTLPRESFSPASIKTLDRDIMYNQKMAASAMAPEEIEMYEDDVAALTLIRDMAIEQKADGAPHAQAGLIELVHTIDTAVREQIPSEIWGWIIGGSTGR